MIFKVEALTVDDGKRIVRGVHRTWTRREALKWMSCYPQDWAVALKKFGRVIALRTFPL
jgi:hypothetical protein